MTKPQIILPEIDMELVRIRATLPAKLAQLLKFDRDSACQILQDWGEGKRPLRELYESTLNELEKFTA